VSLQRKSQLKHPLKLPKQLHQPLSKTDLDDSDIVVDDEVTFGRNRDADKFGKVVKDDLSDYVKFRLWLARQLALMKYKEKWA
jgi:hypothetical protein